MSKELLLKGEEIKDLFMAAVLTLGDKFRDVNEIRVANDEEEPNVTDEMVKEFAPEWSKSYLISLMMKCKIADPLIQDHTKDISVRVRETANYLKNNVK